MTPEEIERNIIKGQEALARARHLFLEPGVDLTFAPGVPAFSADPEDPRRLIRDLDGRRERGVFENGAFKVIED